MHSRDADPILEMYCHQDKRLIIARESGKITRVDFRTGAKKEVTAPVPDYFHRLHDHMLCRRLIRPTVFMKELTNGYLAIVYSSHPFYPNDFQEWSIITLYDLENAECVSSLSIDVRGICNLSVLENDELLIHTYQLNSYLFSLENNKLVEKNQHRKIPRMNYSLALSDGQVLVGIYNDYNNTKKSDQVKICSWDSLESKELSLENKNRDILKVKDFVKLPDDKIAVLTTHRSIIEGVSEYYIHICDLKTQSPIESFLIPHDVYAFSKCKLALIHDQFLVVMGLKYKQNKYFQNMIEIFDVLTSPCRKIKQIGVKENGLIAPMSDGRFAICNKEGKISLHNLLPFREAAHKKVKEFFERKSTKSLPPVLVDIVSQYAGFFSKSSLPIYTVKEKNSEKITHINHLDKEMLPWWRRAFL